MSPVQTDLREGAEPTGSGGSARVAPRPVRWDVPPPWPAGAPGPAPCSHQVSVGQISSEPGRAPGALRISSFLPLRWGN